MVEIISLDKKEGFFDKIKNIYESIFIHPEQLDEWFDSKKKLAFITALIVGILTKTLKLFSGSPSTFKTTPYFKPTIFPILKNWPV